MATPFDYWDQAADMESKQQGWMLTNDSQDRVYIARIDDPDAWIEDGWPLSFHGPVFGDDDEAQAYVIGMAGGRHREALLALWLCGRALYLPTDMPPAALLAPNTQGETMNRYFELVDIERNHHKFWEIVQDGKVVNVHFGRIGTKGQIQVKTFGSNYAADAHVAKLVSEKVSKGYQEKAWKAGAPPAMAPLPVPAKSASPAPALKPTTPSLVRRHYRRQVTKPKEE